jgi:alkylation response protein AidB-like acyl-CoA dehydrogenase
MDLRYSEEHERFRQEVRAFLDANWTDEDRASTPPPEGQAQLLGAVIRTDDRATRFRLKAIDAGYLYRHVPRRWGGGEQPPDPIKEKIIHEEFRRAQAPWEMVGQGPSMLVPTLLEHGTEKQRTRFIRDTLLGKITWCQGYSEPGSGSDLASLRTRAELDGDHWVVNGHKIWTSDANTSDWMFCLVRSEPNAPKHDGISYLLIDMKSPGIDVRPLRQMTGDVQFNEVFFDNVRVPVENMVGKRGQGWTVSRSTLKHERALIGGTHITRRMFDGTVMLAHGLTLRGRPAIQNPIIRSRLVELESRLLASEYHGYRLLTLTARGAEWGRAGMITKLYATTLNYDITRLAMDILGDRGLLGPGDEDAPAMGMFPNAYMWSLGILIAGGTANIQRNIIAERGLGLPRDAAAGRPKGEKGEPLRKSA